MKIESNEIVMIDTHKIQSNPKNMNEHPKDQIERLIKSIDYQGFRNPLVISNRSGFLVAGHGRLEAAKKMNIESLPVIYQDFESEAQEYAYMTSDNALAAWSELDLEKINLEIKEFGDFDIDLLGIQDFEIMEIEKLEPQSDEDSVPEVVDPITKRGDVWLLGKHRVMCGDSTMIDDVEKLMNGEKADMVFTDPPYNQETKGGTGSDIGKAFGKQGQDIDFISNFEPEDFLHVLPSLFNANMNAYVFCNKNLLPDYLSWARDCKYSFNVLIWKKPNAIPIGGSHRPDIEYLLLFRKSGVFNSGISNVNYSKLIEHGRETGLHPTMKPVAIIENQLQIGSNKDSLVIDSFLGSGSTLIACEKTNRKCYGMELDEKYCDVIVKRWQEYTGKEATLESSGETYSSMIGGDL
jgi:DNA modification methylase